MRAIILSLSLTIAWAIAIPAAEAQTQTSDTPQVENARLEKKALNGPLTTEIKSWASNAEQPQWLGYAVPQMGRDRTMCCGDYGGSWGNGCGQCRLEDRDHGTNMTSKDEVGTAKLEAPRSIAVETAAATQDNRTATSTPHRNTSTRRRPAKQSTRRPEGSASAGP